MNNFKRNDSTFIDNVLTNNENIELRNKPNEISIDKFFQDLDNREMIKSKYYTIIQIKDLKFFFIKNKNSGKIGSNLSII